FIEGAAEFDIIDEFNRFFISSIQFFFRGFAGIKKFQHNSEIVNDSLDRLKMGDPVLVCFDFFQGGLSALGLRPEIRIQGKLFFFF
ncbi:MAG TPA: hypothetical protein VFF90_09500, partial [Saprospiraceae bacterium]|nr:hypothetical protein [Saprospiraceae bacterium]